jgi:hypothetical protein
LLARVIRTTANGDKEVLEVIYTKILKCRTIRQCNEEVFEIQLDRDAQNLLGSPTWYCRYYQLTITTASYAKLMEFIRSHETTGLCGLMFKAASGRPPTKVETKLEDGEVIQTK